MEPAKVQKSNINLNRIFPSSSCMPLPMPFFGDYSIDADQNRLEIHLWERSTTMKKVTYLIFYHKSYLPCHTKAKMEVKKQPQTFASPHSGNLLFFRMRFIGGNINNMLSTPTNIILIIIMGHSTRLLILQQIWEERSPLLWFFYSAIK